MHMACKETSKSALLALRGVGVGGSPVTGEFPAQRDKGPVTRKKLPFDDVIVKQLLKYSTFCRVFCVAAVVLPGSVPYIADIALIAPEGVSRAMTFYPMIYFILCEFMWVFSTRQILFRFTNTSQNAVYFVLVSMC